MNINLFQYGAGRELKPYQPRAPLIYELMSDDELVEQQNSDMLFDSESFANYFLIAFKHIATGKVVLFEAPFDEEKLRWLVSHYTCIGFSSFRYDMPMLWLSYVNQDTHVLKKASDDLISGLRISEVQSRYRFRSYPTNHIDLIEVCPLVGSLKLYGARLHADRIQDIPWANEQYLNDWQIPVTRDYCINDLDTTGLLYSNLTEQLNLRRELGNQYNQDFRSRSDAQIAEGVIVSEIRRLRRKSLPRPKPQSGAFHRFQTPENMSFQTGHLQEVLHTVQQATFRVMPNGYLQRPREIETMKISIGNSLYRMGIGGLHSCEKSIAVFADDEHDLVDRDVASYYPAILINCGFTPKNLGEDFLTVYRQLVARRLEAKKRGDQAVSENLKVAANGVFGKTASPFSMLYAPELMMQITVCGQLYLLMLIEELEANGIPVISANTDGFITRQPKHKEKTAASIVAKWEKRTGFVTEETKYRAIYSRDVNAYLAIKQDGGVKGKNVYYDPWRSNNAKDAYWRFQKNPTCQICVEAVEAFLVDGTPLQQTIENCKDIKKFIAVKNVTGGAHQNGEYLGKVIRWYIARGEFGSINYISNNHLVPETNGARAVMNLPKEFPNDVDCQYYIRRAKAMLTDMGYYSKGGEQCLLI